MTIQLYGPSPPARIEHRLGLWGNWAGTRSTTGGSPCTPRPAASSGQRRAAACTGPSAGRRAAGARPWPLALVAGACAGSSGASSDAADPTFERAAGSSITYEEPVADVADLLPPSGRRSTVAHPRIGVRPRSPAPRVASTWSADDGRELGTIRRETGPQGVSEVDDRRAARRRRHLLGVGRVGDGARVRRCDLALPGRWRRRGLDARAPEVPRAATTSSGLSTWPATRRGSW